MHKDEIYLHNLEKVEPFTFDEHVAAVFPDMLRRSVPGYALIQEMIGIVSKRYAIENSILYDLGCSLGASCISMLSNTRDKSIELIGIDNSPAMIKEAKKNLDQFVLENRLRNNYSLLCEDIEQCRFNRGSVVNLNFTLQFIKPEYRQTLMNQIFEDLLPNGILILSEKVSFDHEKDQLLSDLHHDFKRANGYSDLEISQKRTALEEVLIRDKVEQHLERLTKAGFKQTSLWFQCFNFCSFIAIKP